MNNGPRFGYGTAGEMKPGGSPSLAKARAELHDRLRTYAATFIEWFG
jgi:hypothetical protein